MEPDTVLTVISMDSTYYSGGREHYYMVHGVCLTIRSEPADTLFWIAPLPVETVSSLMDDGITEKRILTLLDSGSTWVSGIIQVRLEAGTDRESLFSAFRTWLMDGTVLNLDDVVQRDSIFDILLREKLGIPSDILTDGWLWTRGFRFDPESFILDHTMPEQPILRIGMPSTEGLDTLLIVDLPLHSLNQANMYD